MEFSISVCSANWPLNFVQSAVLTPASSFYIHKRWFGKIREIKISLILALLLRYAMKYLSFWRKYISLCLKISIFFSPLAYERFSVANRHAAVVVFRYIVRFNRILRNLIVVIKIFRTEKNEKRNWKRNGLCVCVYLSLRALFRLLSRYCATTLFFEYSFSHEY